MTLDRFGTVLATSFAAGFTSLIGIGLYAPNSMGKQGAVTTCIVLWVVFFVIISRIMTARDAAAAVAAAKPAEQAAKAQAEAAEKAAMTRAAELARIERETAAAAEALRQDRIALSLMPVGQQVRTVKQRETARLIAEQLAADTAYCNARIEGGWQPKFDDEVAAMKASIVNGTCRAMTWVAFTHFVFGYTNALNARVGIKTYSCIIAPFTQMVNGELRLDHAGDIEAHKNGEMPLEHLIQKLEKGKAHCQDKVSTWRDEPTAPAAIEWNTALNVATAALDELKAKLDEMVAANPLLEATEIFTPGQQTFLPLNEGQGYVYLLKDPIHTGVLKIGMTQHNPRLRAEKFGMELAAYAETVDRVGSERRMHEIFSSVRLGTYELFRVHLSEASAALAKVCGNPVTFIAD